MLAVAGGEPGGELLLEGHFLLLLLLLKVLLMDVMAGLSVLLVASIELWMTTSEICCFWLESMEDVIRIWTVWCLWCSDNPALLGLELMKYLINRTSNDVIRTALV